MAVAIDQIHGFKSFARPPRCKLQSYSRHFDCTMPKFSQAAASSLPLTQSFEVASIHRSFSTPCLPQSPNLEEEIDNNQRIEIIGGHGDQRTSALVVEVAKAMASASVTLVPVSSGLSGAYYLQAQNNDNIAVVKPMDEEPLRLNNPKGFVGQMLVEHNMKRSIRAGETGPRELAAYLLDHGGFAGVPPTTLVKISHVAFSGDNSEAICSSSPHKVASLQQFVDHETDAGDLGPSSFSVSSIHCIGILDVRVLNLDRHTGNMLVKHGHGAYSAGAAELVPIDHGLCLPELLDDPYFEWLHWPQASVPFSEAEIEYVLNLDPFKDAELLRSKVPYIRESSIRVLVLCTIFLKRAVAAGLCLADIGKMMTREFHGGKEHLSVLETICLKAKAKLSSIFSDDKKDNGYQSEEKTELEEDSSSKASNLHQLLQGPGSGNEHKVGGLNWSDMSFFSVPDRNPENGSICLGEMSELGEWELFLEDFEGLLPEVFEGSLMKQKLRTTSCCLY